MIKVRRIGHVTLQTPDIGRQVAYFTDVLGLVTVHREANRAILTTKFGQETVVLEHGTSSRCTRLSLQVSPNDDLSQCAAQLRKEGVNSGRVSDVTPGIADALEFDDPNGTRLQIFNRYVTAAGDNDNATIVPLKLGHAAFVVPDVQLTVKFYTEILGFRVSDWRSDFFVFMRCNPDHHAVNFFRGDVPNLHHIAFELTGFPEIHKACDFLAKKDIELVIGPLRHIIGHNVAIYHRNPDDILVELFTELDQIKDEELGYFDPRPWHQDRPQRPKIWDIHTRTNYWGPGRLVSKDRDK